MKIQARQIIRDAKKLGIQLGRMSYKSCALSVIGRKLNEITPDGYEIKRYAISKKLNMPIEAVVGVECGFEGWDNLREIYNFEDGYESKIRFSNKNPVFKRYYKVGQKVAEMAGLPPK